MNTTLALTWSPAPSCYTGLYNASLQHCSCLVILRKILSLRKTSYELYPELNVAGNIHYHGTLWITDSHDYVTFYKSVLPTLKRHGFVVLKKIPNDEAYVGWKKYLLKDTDRMRLIIPDHLQFNEGGQCEGVRLTPIKRLKRVGQPTIFQENTEISDE